MEADASWAERTAKWRQELHQTKKILIPVISNQLLTLSGWYYVYNCETDPKSFAYYLLDSRHTFTTGSDVYDGMLNGVICISILAVMSFFMLLVAIYNFRRLIQAWLSTSCLLILFMISSLFIRDAFAAAGITQYAWLWTLLLTLIYGAGGAGVFFSTKFPRWSHQLYVVTNCAMISMYYLRMLPAHTTWFVLAMIILWDAFAVLAPQGPLKLINGCAENYSAHILQFLMFTTEVEPVKAPETSSSDADTRSDDCSTAEEIDSEFAANGEKTAKDALNDDNSIRLGLGDFVFYSVLVGKAAASGSPAATLAAMVGVLLGLIITLTIFSDSEDTIPALPCSIALGIVFHFGTLCVLEPAYFAIFDLFFNHLPSDARMEL